MQSYKNSLYPLFIIKKENLRREIKFLPEPLKSTFICLYLPFLVHPKHLSFPNSFVLHKMIYVCMAQKYFYLC